MPSKFREMLQREVDQDNFRMIDIRDPQTVEIIRNGDRLWINVDEQCVLRIQGEAVENLDNPIS